MTIPVVFSTDENYIFYTCVAITSLARSAAPGTEYDIHVLMGEEPGENAAALLGELRRRHPNIRVSTVRVDGARFRNVVINNGHVTRAAFYRLALADLLGVDRCIYLDSDILVTDDLSPLYLADLGDCCLAGCRDIWIDLMEETEREERRERADLPSMDGYVNSGVLVMDLGKIREEGLDEMFLRHAGRDYQYEDQDILNVCCYGRIRLLSARWNIFALFLGEERMLRESGISGDVLRQYQEKKGIIHYATPFTRPWEHSRYRACREWWEAAAEWEDTGQYRELYGRVCIRERRGNAPAMRGWSFSASRRTAGKCASGCCGRVLGIGCGSATMTRKRGKRHIRASRFSRWQRLAWMASCSSTQARGGAGKSRRPWWHTGQWKGTSCTTAGKSPRDITGTWTRHITWRSWRTSSFGNSAGGGGTSGPTWPGCGGCCGMTCSMNPGMPGTVWENGY